MLLIVGLGNPGSDYADNRHNIGFKAVDAIHRRHGFAAWRNRFQSALAEGVLGGAKAILLKPQTYVNLSGQAVGEAVRFYKLAPKDVLVIQDEIDLPAAKLRMKAGGGHGGHNGLRSITQHIGDGYRRMRLGVGHPGDKGMVRGHVLKDFAKADRAWLDPLLEAIAEYAPLLAEGQDATFANRLHEKLQYPKPARNALNVKTLQADSESGSEPETPARPKAGRTKSTLARGLRKLLGGG